MEMYQNIGKIKRSFGKDGELTITLQQAEDTIKPQTFLFVKITDIFVPFQIERIEKVRGQIIVRFYDYTSAEKINFLLGEPLYILQSATPPSEKTVEDLSCFIGFKFIDQTSGDEGVITNFYDYRNNPLWGATLREDSTEEVLIPCVEEFIVSIDPKNQKMTLTLPEGLLIL